MLLYASGMRISELCGLSWRDLQPAGDTGQVTVFGKGGQTRAIRLPCSVWRQLVSLKPADAAPPDPVFLSGKPPGTRRLQPRTALRIVRAASKRANLDEPVSPHWLRHAHASHALDRGAPIHLVQATLGHANINTTSLYLHARPQDSSSRFLSL